MHYPENYIVAEAFFVCLFICFDSAEYIFPTTLLDNFKDPIQNRYRVPVLRGELQTASAPFIFILYCIINSKILKILCMLFICNKITYTDVHTQI